MESKKIQTKLSHILIAIAILAVILLPILVKSIYILGIMVVIGISTIVIVGLSLLMGYAGQISLGHAAFYGLGAYTSAILSTTYHLNAWLSLIAAAALTGLIAYLIGIPILKLKEHYLALATLGFGLIVHAFFVEESALTGGPSGLSGIPTLSLGSFSFNTDFKYYYLVWAVVIMTIILAYNIVNSRVGRALRSIHGSEYAAQSLGVNTTKYKLQVFTLSAVLASIAGSLYTHYMMFISPSSFDFMASVHFVVMVAIGGLGSVWGPIVGAGTIVILGEFLKDMIPRIFPNATGEYQIIVFGTLLVIIMIFMPEGLVYGIKKSITKKSKLFTFKQNIVSQKEIPAEGESL